ncbi:MAG: hypothetical protein ABEJ08_05740 [Halobacteriaceae archaeon]
MDIEELRRVRTHERETDSPQELRDSFYDDVADYVGGLKAERDRAAAAAEDPFADDTVAHLTDEIETAEQVAEAIYEARVGKIVKQASLAAAGMGTDVEGLTTEERDLHADLVDRIQQNKSRILGRLGGESDDATDAEQEDGPSEDRATGEPGAGTERGTDRPTGEAESTAASEDAVTAADAMGGETGRDGESSREDPLEGGVSGGGNQAAGDRASPDGGTTTRTDPPDDGAGRADAASAAVASSGPEALGRSADADTDREAGADADTDREAGADADTDTGERSSDELAGDRETVRITDDVGEILGVDDHVYNLAADDVVTLPETNAAVLVDRDAAEPLE